MRTTFQIIALAVCIAFSLQSEAQTEGAVFPKGELSTTKNHTGNIWLNELMQVIVRSIPVSLSQPTMPVQSWIGIFILGVKFYSSRKARAITRKRGKPVRIVHKGDVIKCLPGVEHWHGASLNSGFAYIAVTPTQKGKTIWLEPVSNKDYQSVK